MGLISLLCKILRHATVTVPNAAPAEDDLSIDGDPTFTYHDGKWYSGKLKLAVKDGSSLADYQGTYTLNLPDGVTTTTGESQARSSSWSVIRGQVLLIRLPRQPRSFISRI
ncbi:hypothetical protein [Limosilactobacillus mucosae]|uniref:hypothetical protein n=1 Tax=Limosilactobacillus mucosae TaxID=97478 RepID=UPI0022E5FDEA|nr:hypothetical protein [Limosilactobacillus mucosae]